MRKAKRVISREKQVLLVGFSLIFPRFPLISKTRLNTSLILQMKTVCLLVKETFLLVYKFLSLLLNELLQSEIMQKLPSVQNITRIITISDEKSGPVCLFVVFRFH